MGKFVIRRLAQAVMVVIAATILLFIGLFVLGDPFASSGDKVVPPETQAILREKFGMDQSLPMQYLTYLGNLVTGDLGIDLNQRRPVADMIGAALPNTARLALIAIIIDVIIGVVAGIIAAVWRYSFWDVLVTIITTLAIGVPTFVIGVWLRQTVSGVWIFPQVPRSFTELAPWYTEVLLPAVTLAIVDAAFIARLMRGSMLEVLRMDYIRTARAKGLGERTVIMKHAFRNSIIPVVTYVGISIGILLGGAIITETLFQYNGVGYLLYRSILQNNNPVIMAIVTFAVLIYVLLSMIVDILYAYLDPRIRLS
ncbi:ABC transporter permease [Actinophytocola algeriensis]|uniref:ABC-type dipeptide/oligopeptide/nickel transport system permease component n=1 Tax=Actinophytocola algeriensis TaxID=1768010 RepID=A0A7W7VIU5_9PSEU|nr:ABC transporter permease [Actinophytocola algeriensis]MBB4911937.1 ABC-type dipeptide/oligopeptide/nickel transport system permease component [Actinophytocola algeriensis]MBE1477571.1 ABC-type dipeptide/oligopeptide/nickel transport system permease component [Actinophytocola algeriensis]